MSSSFFDTNNFLLAQNLKSLIEREDGLSASALAEKLGVARNKISRILNGEVEDPKASTLTPIAQYFGVTIDELLGIKPLSNTKYIKQAETTLLVEKPFVKQENIINWIKNDFKPDSFFKIAIQANQSFEDCFITQVDSNALNPIITSSMYLIVQKDQNSKNGDFVVAMNMENVILRKFYKEGNDTYLSSINPIYKVININKEWIIVGKVIDARLFLT